VLENYANASRALRELKFLRMLHLHENIITVKDVLIPNRDEKFQDIYVVFEKFPADLSRILRSRTVLRRDHIKLIMFQILFGIEFLHRARVFHRDLKPSNILLNEKCHVRICDFGLARAAPEDREQLIIWTDYVATRWYRAPELIFVHLSQYSTAIDMWSVGCIFAEILRRGRPLFPGRNTVEQIDLITQVTGKPSTAVIEKLRSPQARDIVSNIPRREPLPLSKLIPDASEEEIYLISRMLTFDPDERISAQEALQNSYFSVYFNLLQERFQPAPMFNAADFEFERKQYNEDQMRFEFRQESLFFNAREEERASGGFNYVSNSQAKQFDRQMRDMEAGNNFRQTNTMPNEKMTENDDDEEVSSLLSFLPAAVLSSFA